MNFKIENCENKGKIKLESAYDTKTDRTAILEQAILFIINDKMSANDKEVICNIFYQRGLYDILEDAIEEAERLKNNH